MPTDVLILAVMYNTYTETIRYLDSISNLNYPDVSVVLVDNSDKEDLFFKEIICSNYPYVTYWKPENNLGYFGGARVGLEYYLKQHQYPKWIAVSNVDLVFEGSFFKTLRQCNYAEDIAVIAPSIISQKWKIDTNPKIISRYTSFQMKFYKFVCTNVVTQNLFMTLSYFKKTLKRLKGNSHAVHKSSIQETRVIYAPHGSFILFRDNYFFSGGNLNHISFLFGEEIFVAETLRSINRKVVYDPRLVLFDFEHASTGFFYSKKIAAFMKQSTLDIIEHYY